MSAPTSASLPAGEEDLPASREEMVRPTPGRLLAGEKYRLPPSKQKSLMQWLLQPYSLET